MLRVFILSAGLSMLAGAQSVVLTGSGNLTATPIENSSSYSVTGSGTATLTGYGTANITITGSAQPGNVVLSMSLDFGAGNVLSGSLGISGEVFETDYSETPYSAFVVQPGAGQFANETGSIGGAMSLTLMCQTPTHPCSDTMSGPFSFNTNGLISPQADRAALSFSETDIPVAGGQGADHVIAADLNGDGKTDLAIFSISAGIVTILLGNGDGTFQSPPHTYTNLSSNPHNIAVADLNGDEKPDILVMDDNNMIFTMLGNGDGSFQSPKLALQYVGCCSVAVGDWNGDKKLDIATSSQSFLGNGDGTFGPATNLPGGFFTNILVTTADLNRDGKADLVVTNYSHSLVLAFLGNGDGTFQAPTSVQASITPGALAVGDLNGDGKPDLAFADGGNAYIDVFVGNGDGTFRPSVVITSLDTVYPAIPALAFADIDRDGKLDMIAATFNGFVGSGLADIYLGKNDGTFLVPVSFALNNSPTSMVVTDLNMDGKPDIITTSSTGAGLTILINTSVVSPPSGLPAVNTNPVSLTVPVGQMVSFTASASGTPAPTLQWQVSTDDGLTFYDIPGATSGTYSFTSAASENANRYRAVFTNSSGSVLSAVATLTVLSPMLTIQKTHTGEFLLGQLSATYQVTVTNSLGTQPTHGVITVTERPPSGLTLVSMNGSGWTCPGTAANNCTRSDPLGVGASYPSIEVTVSVAANATSPQVNAVSVSGGGSVPAGAADSATIIGGAPSGLGLFTLTPCRAVDTRSSQGKSGANGPPAMTASAARNFSLPLSGCGVPNEAEAYSLNFTVVPPGPLQYLSAWPTGEPYPGVSTLNSTDGSTLANAAIVPAGAQASTAVLTSDTTDLIIDVNGYFAAPNGNELAFYPVTPCRVVDTRPDQHKTGAFGAPALAAGAERNFPMLSSTCDIPSTAQAYSLNLTAVPLGPLPYLSTWPADKGYPNVSTLNSPDGSTIANAAIVPAAANGDITVLAGGATDFIIDVNGYFAAASGPGALHFYPMTPCRVADTRSSQPFSGAFGPPSLAGSAPRDFPLQSSVCGIPPTAQAYSLNFTVVPQGPLQYLSVWPSGQPYPNVSTLNSPKGTTLANAAIVPAGANGAITVLAGNATDLIIDINGYFAP